MALAVVVVYLNNSRHDIAAEEVAEGIAKLFRGVVEVHVHEPMVGDLDPDMIGWNTPVQNFGQYHGEDYKRHHEEKK